jgi:antitoxin component of RelBE/YafQ-DinJ toxin-antitoxin module
MTQLIKKAYFKVYDKYLKTASTTEITVNIDDDTIIYITALADEYNVSFDTAVNALLNLHIMEKLD